MNVLPLQSCFLFRALEGRLEGKGECFWTLQGQPLFFPKGILSLNFELLDVSRLEVGGGRLIPGQTLLSSLDPSLEGLVSL